MPAKESRVYQVLALAVMAGMALLVLATFRDYGITNDEELQDNYGHMLLAYYASGLTDHTAFGYQDLCLYGGLFDLMAALFERVLPLGTYESRHLLGGLAGLLGLAGAWRLGRHLGGERAGFLAVALTVLTPALYGHNFNNPKDAPFAIAMLWSLYFSVRASEDFPRPRLATVLGLGLAFGAALSVRVGALLVPFYAAFAVAVFLAAGLVRGRRQPRPAPIPRPCPSRPPGL